MTLQVLPLKVLVSRQVVKRRMDYSANLIGTAKEELDRLDKLVGIEDSKTKLKIEGGEVLPSNDWQDLKNMVPETLIHIVEGKADFSIIEILNNGKRTWVERGVGGKAEDLMPATGYWHETNQETWVHREGYVEDGRLVNWTKVSKMYNGERRLSLFLYHSFATDAQGNLLRRFICSRPDLGYKITKDIWATKIPGEISIQKELAGLDDSNRLEHWYPLVYQWYVWYVVNH